MNHLVLKFGVEVHDRQKHAGTLHKVVVNPEGTHVTHLLIQQGLLFKHCFVLPLETVACTFTEELHLNLNHDEISNFPTFEERSEEVGMSKRDIAALQRAGGAVLQAHNVDYLASPEAGLLIEKQLIREGVNIDDMLWSSHTTLHTFQGYAGNLAQVVVDAEDGRLQQLVMRQGKLMEKFLVVPVELIEQCNEVEIQLGIREETLENLSPYDPYNMLDFIDLSSKEEPPLAGGKPHTNNLFGELTTILAEDPRTKTAVIEIICEGGTVSLSGDVKDQKIKEAATELVGRHPQVITVNNNLKVQPNY